MSLHHEVGPVDDGDGTGAFVWTVIAVVLWSVILGVLVIAWRLA